jgi:hypothetical protein
MKRKIITAAACIGTFLFIGALVFVLVFHFRPLMLKPLSSVSSQNLTVPVVSGGYSNSLSCSGDSLYYAVEGKSNSTLYRIKGKELTALGDVGSSFQVAGDSVYSLDDGILEKRKLNSQAEEVIATDIGLFAVCGTNIYLLDFNDSFSIVELATGKIRFTAKKVEEFYVFAGNPFILKSDSEESYQVSKIDAATLQETIIGTFSWPSWTITYVLPVYRENYLFDVDTELIVQNLSEEPDKRSNVGCNFDNADDKAKDLGVEPRIEMTTSGSDIFVSADPAITQNPLLFGTRYRTVDTGLWKVSYPWISKTKISNNIYDELLAENESTLFGIRDRKLYEIDAKTGEETQITLLF